MTILKAPQGTLTDDVVELRVPSPDAGDVAAINHYVDNEQLDGGWLPEVPLVTGQRLVNDWLDCWHGRDRRGDGTFAFVVTVPEQRRFVGVVGITEGDDGALDITYGTAPAWRGRGVASRAARLAAGWAARQPGVHTVEVLIEQGQRACERVAVKAGFVLSDTMTTRDQEGGVAVELRYVMDKPEAPSSA